MRKLQFSSIVMLMVLGCIADIAAGGMIDTLGEFETESEELTEDRAVRVGDRELVLQAGSAASFYVEDEIRTDSLYKGRLAEDAVISTYGKELIVRAPNIVWFYKSGKLKYTTDIAEPAAFLVQGREVMFDNQYDVYVPLGFHENGHVFQGILFEPTELKVQEGSSLFGGLVVFAEEGQLLYGTLLEDSVVTVQGREFTVPAGDDVAFYDNGTVKDLPLPEGGTEFRIIDTMVWFIPNPAVSTRVLFYANENVMSGCLAEDTVFTVEGEALTLKSGTPAFFNEDGTLQSGTLTDGTVFPAEE